jgi:hypothetical protein
MVEKWTVMTSEKSASGVERQKEWEHGGYAVTFEHDIISH